MKKIDLGQTIGIFANLGVLVGILLLVYELNQNRQMMQAQTRSSISDALVDIQIQLAQNPELADIRMKVAAGEPLTDLEARLFRDLQTGYWRYRDNVHYQYRNGLFEEGEYLALREAWRIALNSELVRTTWCGRRVRHSPDFAEEIDTLLDEPCE